MVLTLLWIRGILFRRCDCCAGVAQPVEQLICNQQVGGSNPSTSSIKPKLKRQLNMGVFPSGQRGQTVNLLLFSYDGSNPSAPTTKPLRTSNLMSLKYNKDKYQQYNIVKVQKKKATGSA